MPSAKYTDSFLDEMKMIADPQADAVVAAIIEQRGPEEAFALFNILIRHIHAPEPADVPQEVTDFFNNSGHLDARADPLKIKKGQELFLDFGPAMLLFLFYKSLPILYSYKDGAEVLMQTGRLARPKDNDLSKFARRITETGQFLVDVMTPGNLDPGGKGIATTQRIRLIHASIRAFVGLQHWDSDKLGAPINQEELAFTLMSFSISLLEALEDFGADLEEDKKEGYFHVWQSLAPVLGIHPKIVPATMEEGRELMEAVIRRHGGSSEGGIILTSALIEFAKQTLPGKAMDVLPEVVIRHLIGDEMSDWLGVKNPKGCLTFLVPRLMRGWLGLTDKLEDFDGPLQKLANQMGLKMIDALIGIFNNYKQSKFEVPEVMMKRWKG